MLFGLWMASLRSVSLVRILNGARSRRRASFSRNIYSAFSTRLPTTSSDCARRCAGNRRGGTVFPLFPAGTASRRLRSPHPLGPSPRVRSRACVSAESESGVQTGIFDLLVSERTPPQSYRCHFLLRLIPKCSSKMGASPSCLYPSNLAAIDVSKILCTLNLKSRLSPAMSFGAAWKIFSMPGSESISQRLLYRRAKTGR